MKARDRILAAAGANMNESMGGTRLDGAGGLSAILPVSAARPATVQRYEGLNRVKGAFQIPLDRVMADPNQPRKEFDPESLQRLARSLKERGQLQPIRVRWDSRRERWVIIAGERRWRAAAVAGLPCVTAIEATEPLTADEVLEEQLIENCLRDDLRPVEQAHAFQGLMDRRGWNQKQLAEALQMHPSAVTRALTLLALPAPVRQAVDNGALAPSAAVALAKLATPGEQVAVAEHAVQAGLNRDEIAAVVQSRTAAAGASTLPRKRPERPRPFRAEFVFDDGAVSVTLRDPDATPLAVAALLKAALAQVQAQIAEIPVERDTA